MASMNDLSQQISDFRYEMQEQLGKLQNNYESLRNSHANLAEKTEHLEHVITGNGNPEDGLIIKLDRLSEEHKKRQVWYKAAVSGAVTACIGAIVALIKVFK